MKLEHKILCIDNNISSLRRPKTSLKKANDEVGIKTTFVDIQVKPTATEKQSDFLTRIKRECDEKFDEHEFFDLILIDLHMQDKGANVSKPITGSDFIDYVREHTIYRPIVFYSAGVPASDARAIKQLNKKIYDDDKQGKNLMVCARSKLSGFLESIAVEMQKEEQKINHVRGLLMDQVSEIDAKIVSRIEALWHEIPKEKRDAVKNRVKERAKNSVRNSEKLCDKIKSADFDKMLNHVSEYSSFDLNARIMILETILGQFDDFSDALEVLRDIRDSSKKKPDVSLLHLRNLYAHTLASVLEPGHVDSRCKYIREQCRHHSTNLDSITR